MTIQCVVYIYRMSLALFSLDNPSNEMFGTDQKTKGVTLYFLTSKPLPCLKTNRVVDVSSFVGQESQLYLETRKLLVNAFPTQGTFARSDGHS